MLGMNFPVSSYYKDNILDAETLARGGGWWTAVLLIEDPKSGEPFVAMYRWQKDEERWKVRKSFSCRKKQEATKLMDIIRRFSAKLP